MGELKKKKPTVLEWGGGILNLSEDKPVTLKNKEKGQENKKCEVKKIEGRLNIRLEKKGRAGNPVLILSQFSSSEAQNKESLKQLCSDLKNKFACGGTLDNNEIILMIRDIDKLKKVLKDNFNLISN